jgi:hypothetical protein
MEILSRSIFTRPRILWRHSCTGLDLGQTGITAANSTAAGTVKGGFIRFDVPHPIRVEAITFRTSTSPTDTEESLRKWKFCGYDSQGTNGLPLNPLDATNCTTLTTGTLLSSAALMGASSGGAEHYRFGLVSPFDIEPGLMWWFVQAQAHPNGGSEQYTTRRVWDYPVGTSSASMPKCQGMAYAPAITSITDSWPTNLVEGTAFTFQDSTPASGNDVNNLSQLDIGLILQPRT